MIISSQSPNISPYLVFAYRNCKKDRGDEDGTPISVQKSPSGINFERLQRHEIILSTHRSRHSCLNLVLQLLIIKSLAIPDNFGGKIKDRPRMAFPPPKSNHLTLIPRGGKCLLARSNGNIKQDWHTG